MRNKIVALLLVVLMAMGISSAFADEHTHYVPFSQKSIPAAITTTVPVTDDPYYGFKERKPGYLYVRHYLWSSIPGYYGSSNYTNFFQATIPDSSVRYGGNWMAPGTANYVRSNNIVTQGTYGVAARANTKYADDGFTTIQITGYMDSDS